MLFKAIEIRKIAVQIEKNGESFYTAVKGKVHDPKAKELLEYLAREEAQHIIDFENILKDVSLNDSPESYPGEFDEYMNALLEENVFIKDNLETIVSKITNHIEAIDVALRFEKDSLLFFNELKKVVANIDEKSLDALIAQEQEHIRKLTRAKKEMQ